MEYLLPDGRAGSALDSCDHLPVDSKQKEAECYREEEVANHVIFL